MGSTRGYDVRDHIITPEDGVQVLQTWVPHSFFPVPDVGEDTIIMIWAHPDGTQEDMDEIFFRNLLLYISDVSEKKATLDPLQIMLTQ
jgi:hypothetical protein